MAPGDIIVPVHKGKKGHPTIFPRPVLDQLVEPLTLRDLLRSNSSLVLPVPVPDIGVTIDMDAIEDYERMRMMFSSLNAIRYGYASHESAASLGAAS